MATVTICDLPGCDRQRDPNSDWYTVTADPGMSMSLRPEDRGVLGITEYCSLLHLRQGVMAETEITAKLAARSAGHSMPWETLSDEEALLDDLYESERA